MYYHRAAAFRMCFLLPVAALALMCACHRTEPGPSEEPSEMQDFFAKPCLLGAHRSGEGMWPESTVLAFTEAAKRWPSMILETDSRLTSDGQVVLLHDSKVDRTTDGEGKVSELTLAQVKALDAGFRFTTDGGKTFPYRGQGMTIPLLKEVLAAVPEARIQIDIKGEEKAADATIAVIREAGAERRVLLSSFRPAAMKRVRETAPEIARTYDFENGAVMLAALRDGDWASYKAEDQMLSLSEEFLPKFGLKDEELQAIRAKGVRLQIHTVNTRESILRYLRMGVDSLLTDNPALLVKVVEEWEASEGAPASE